MIIYFEDGDLSKVLVDGFSNMGVYTINSHIGVSEILKRLSEIEKKNNKSIVYTNSILALNNEYAWDSNYSFCNIYLRSPIGEFKNISMFTREKITKESDIAKLYLEGYFSDFKNDSGVYSSIKKYAYKSFPIDISAIQWNGNNNGEIREFLSEDQTIRIRFDSGLENLVIMDKSSSTELFIVHKNNYIIKIDNIISVYPEVYFNSLFTEV